MQFHTGFSSSSASKGQPGLSSRINSLQGPLCVCHTLSSFQTLFSFSLYSSPSFPQGQTTHVTASFSQAGHHLREAVHSLDTASSIWETAWPYCTKDNPLTGPLIISKCHSPVMIKYRLMRGCFTESCNNKHGTDAPGSQQVWQSHPPLHLCTGTTRRESMTPAWQMFSGLPSRKPFLTPGCGMVFQPTVSYQAETDALYVGSWGHQPVSTPGCSQGCTSSLMCPCNTNLQ